MKVLSSMLLLFLFAVSASAQALANRSVSPEVTVIQKKWRMDIRNPALEKDPLRSIKQREQEVIAQKETTRVNQSRIRLGLPTLPPRVRVPAPDTGSGRLLVSYIYEVK